MTIPQQIQQASTSYKVVRDYLKAVKVAGLTVESLLDKMLDGMAGDYAHIIRDMGDGKYLYLLSIYDFEYHLDEGKNLFAADLESEYGEGLEYDYDSGEWA